MVNRIITGLVFITTLLLLSVKAAPTAGPYVDVDGFQAGKRDASEIGSDIEGRDGNGLWVDRRVVGNGGHAW
jgi:hypothetical protein